MLHMSCVRGSRAAKEELQAVAPTTLLYLAADPSLPVCNNETAQTYQYLHDKVRSWLEVGRGSLTTLVHG